jgi:hypothetical protein
MRFLWKTQLKQERGRFVQKEQPARKKVRKSPVSDTRNTLTLMGVAFLWFLFFGTAGYLVLFSSYLSLASPTVSGREHISAEDFDSVLNQELSERYFGRIERARFFLLRPRALEQTLRERFPLIREVTVTRTFPTGLTVVLSERKDIIVWCAAHTCHHVLEDGTVRSVMSVYEGEENRVRTLTITDESGQALPNEGKIFEPQFVAFPGEVRTALWERLGLETDQRMRVTSRFGNELRVRTEGGWEIFFATDIPLETSLDALSLLLDKEIPAERRADLLYIDLRTENRVFYRFQEGKETKEPEVAPVTETGTKESKKKEKK